MAKTMRGRFLASPSGEAAARRRLMRAKFTITSHQRGIPQPCKSPSDLAGSASPSDPDPSVAPRHLPAQRGVTPLREEPFSRASPAQQAAPYRGGGRASAMAGGALPRSLHLKPLPVDLDPCHGLGVEDVVAVNTQGHLSGIFVLAAIETLVKFPVPAVGQLGAVRRRGTALRGTAHRIARSRPAADCRGSCR